MESTLNHCANGARAHVRVTEVNEGETGHRSRMDPDLGPNVVIPPDDKCGADNSVYVARILWDKPNAAWNKR